jgi:hypothetical protein
MTLNERTPCQACPELPRIEHQHALIVRAELLAGHLSLEAFTAWSAAIDAFNPVFEEHCLHQVHRTSALLADARGEEPMLPLVYA